MVGFWELVLWYFLKHSGKIKTIYEVKQRKNWNFIFSVLSIVNPVCYNEAYTSKDHFIITSY